MRSIRHPSAGVRAALLSLVFAAMLMRILVPQGWMPSSGGLTMCVGGERVALPAAAQALLAEHGVPIPNDTPPPHDAPCAFAGFGHALAVPLLPVLLLPALAIFAPVAATRLTIAIGRGLAAPPPPSTGPPTTI